MQHHQHAHRSFSQPALLILASVTEPPRNGQLDIQTTNAARSGLAFGSGGQNGISPKVWIIVLPVLFLVVCMQWEFFFADDNSNFGDVLIAWLLPSLASLIILLVIKLGSRKSTDLQTQEALQQVQVQG